MTRPMAANQPGPADVLSPLEIIRELAPGLVKLTLVKCRASTGLHLAGDLASVWEKMRVRIRVGMMIQ